VLNKMPNFIEKIKPVGNPLTIVAIFAALADALSTVALGLINTQLQNVFIWFVMLFPILIVALFFITLNFNATVLYAPKDFVDESHFFKLFSESKKKVKAEKNNLEKEIDKTAELIIKDTGANREWSTDEENKLKTLLSQSLSPDGGNISTQMIKYFSAAKAAERQKSMLNNFFDVDQYQEVRDELAVKNNN
jgi:hypothetical protein